MCKHNPVSLYVYTRTFYKCTRAFFDTKLIVFKKYNPNNQTEIFNKKPLTPIVSHGKILLLCLKVGVVRPFDNNESAKTVQKLNFIKQKQLKK